MRLNHIRQSLRNYQPEFSSVDEITEDIKKVRIFEHFNNGQRSETVT